MRKNKAYRSLIVVSALWLVMISTPFFPDLLIKHLENQYEVFSPKVHNNFSKPLNILVLGGGFTNDYRLPASDKLCGSALSRLVEGVRLQKQIPLSTLITSGDGGKEEISQAEVLANAALLFGLDSSKIKLQKRPRNTWEEALEYKHLYGDSIQLIIVSSAIHMPRAMYLFHKAGLKPIAAPTDHLLKIDKNLDPLFWIPSSNNISKVESAIHEYAGILWARL